MVTLNGVNIYISSMVSGLLGLIVEVSPRRGFAVAVGGFEVVAAVVAGRNVGRVVARADGFQLREDGIPTLAKGCEVVEEASGATVRQLAALQAGINSDKAKELNKFIKGLGIKGVQSQTQGDQLRVISKKRDHLQTVISELKDAEFDIPLQFENFRD